jgi:hypothetical protein
MTTSTTKTATTGTDGCAYIYRQLKLTRCDRTREHHDRVRGLGHEFVGIDTQPPEHDAGLRDYLADGIARGGRCPRCGKANTCRRSNTLWCDDCAQATWTFGIGEQSDTAQSSREAGGEHSPTPWWWVDRSEHSDIASADSEVPFGIHRESDVVYGVEPIADICNFPPATASQTARQRANAEFIVRCVNAHESLIAALSNLIDYAAGLELLLSAEGVGYHDNGQMGSAALALRQAKDGK